MKESRYNIWLSKYNRWYVYNGLSGALVELSDSEYSNLMNLLGGETPLTVTDYGLTGLLPDLQRAKVVLDDECDELEILTARYSGAASDNSSLGLTLVPNLGCNFDCPYCFEDKHPSLMSDEVQAAIVALVEARMAKASRLVVCWFGGEPLMGTSVLFALSDRFMDICEMRDARYSASIVTNGYLLNKKMCIELAARKVSHAQITLDGPPDVHNRMRPTVGGRGTFERIMENLGIATGYFDVSVRVNVDADNVHCTGELLQILHDRGLAGKCRVYMGQLMGITENDGAPSASYSPRLLTRAEFARESVTFNRTARSLGFAPAALPRPTAVPCTAIRSNDLVIGSEGELYKCYESIGNGNEIIGNILDVTHINGREQKWLSYTPFDNEECRSCVALPGCMGGCANHAMDRQLYPNRCGTFRHSYKEQISDRIDLSLGVPVETGYPIAPSSPSRRLLPLEVVNRK